MVSRPKIPGTDFLTDVAPVRVLANRGTLRGGNRALQLDREIGKALCRIEHVRIDQGTGRAGIEAPGACSTLVGRPRIDLQLQIADDLREEDPRAEFLADQTRVLAYPAQAGI